MAKRSNTTQRGIPSVADYAHWGEEAEQVWYAENRYDMEHPSEDEPEDDGWLDLEDDD